MAAGAIIKFCLRAMTWSLLHYIGTKFGADIKSDAPQTILFSDFTHNKIDDGAALLWIEIHF